MSIALTDYDLSRVPLIQSGADECRALAAEVKIAVEQLPLVESESKELRHSLDKMAPSRLVAFGDSTRDAFMSWRRAELIRSALVASLAHHRTLLSTCDFELRREQAEFIQRVLSTIKTQAERDALRATQVAGDPAHTNAARLLALCNASSETSKP